ncbi:TraB/GumN family protein [uncultured Flavobacterium sp.]|uniref:TraB/GumN family protein n=1 Tax=uncultured Flavobacterium sp. TaxID=165435 RepID=UPI0030EF94AE|tara:strand:+ start:63832 stop:64689 length:858 start_codon:yes stop_codon:yes gene_type:complete
MTRFIFVLTSILFGYIANAQQLEKSLLWKISGNGLEKPSYLFGTMHAVCEINFDDAIKKALDETSQMYLEIDMDDPTLQATMMKGMMMKDGITMSSLMTEDEVKIVDAFLKENVSVSIKMVDRFKPFMISAMFIPKLLECPMQTIETELVKISKEQKEEVYGLETILDQLTVFDKIPYKTQVEELVKTAKDNMVKDKIEMKKMLDIYDDEDIEAMLEIMDESENKIASDFNDILLNDRNANWIPIIEKVSKEKPTFYGVGAGHLAGEKGVIKLLRKRGYKVEAVK